METLVGMLEQRRIREKQSHEEFARRLGISRVWWSYLRHGKGSIGKKMWSRAIDEFPELGHIPVSLFLSNEVTKC